MTEKISELTDDQLLMEMMDWIRIGRNEGELYGQDRQYFKSICKEIAKRGLLKKNAKQRIFNPE